MTDKIEDFTDLITAGEARAPDPALRATAVLANLSAIIGQEARLGKKSTRVPGNLVAVRGSSAEFNVAGVHEAVVGAGYRLNTRSENRQFADVRLEISWGDGGMMGTFLFYLGALLGIMAMVVPLVYGVRPPADAIAASYGAALFWMVFGLGLHFLHIRTRK